jgi:hypothetical protein
MAVNKASDYYPTKIKLEVLKNRIYLLRYQQFGREHKKILTKAACIKQANDPNVRSEIRDVIINAFEEGAIA